MLINDTKLPVIEGSITIMLISSIWRIKIWQQNSLRSVVSVLSPPGWRVSISTGIRKSLSSPASDSVGFPSWKIFLYILFRFLYIYTHFSYILYFYIYMYVYIWPFVCMLIPNSSLWQLQRFSIWEDDNLLSTKSVIYKRKKCFINVLENCILRGVMFSNYFQVWSNLLS